MFGRFKSHRQAERFLFAHDQINLIFRHRQYKLTATSYRHARSDAFKLWDDYTAEIADEPAYASEDYVSNLAIPFYHLPRRLQFQLKQKALVRRQNHLDPAGTKVDQL